MKSTTKKNRNRHKTHPGEMAINKTKHSEISGQDRMDNEGGALMPPHHQQDDEEKSGKN